MNSRFFAKTKKIFRKVISLTICVMMVLQAFIQAYGADNDSAESGYESYKWTLIESEEQLRKYTEPGKTDQDEGRMFISEKGNKNLNDNDANNWFKVLIAYKTDGKEYIFSGSTMVEDGEEFAASRVLSTYFLDDKGQTQHIGDKVLNSSSGLFAPYIKYQGEEDGHPRIYIRFAEADSNGKDKLGSNTMIGNLSWYGVAHHACGYGEFVKTSAASPSGTTHSGACSHSTYWEHIIKFGSNKQFQAYFNPSGADNRYWTYDEHDYTVEYNCDPEDDESSFYLYFGVPVPGKIMTQSLIVEPMTTTYNTVVLAKDALMEIPKGACVILDGFCKVQGSILVNGGILIIRGTVDTASGTSSGGDNESALSPGSIKVINGGTLRVESTGVLCMRLATSNLIIEKGSQVRIDGGCAVAGKIKVTDSLLFVGRGAALIHGAKIAELAEAQNLGKNGISDNQTKTLDYFVSNDCISDTYKDNQGKLVLGNNAGFYAFGLYYRNTTFTKAAFAINSAVRAEARTNYHAKISDMMWQW